MNDERLNSILGKFKDAGVARDKRDEEAAQKAREAAEVEKVSKEQWPNIRDTINAEVAALNQQLKSVGYELHKGVDEIDDLFAGSITIGFEPVGYRDGKLDRLKFVALKTGTFRSSYGTKNMSPAGTDAGWLAELDANKIRKTLLDFLEKNIPS